MVIRFCVFLRKNARICATLQNRAVKKINCNVLKMFYCNYGFNVISIFMQTALAESIEEKQQILITTKSNLRLVFRNYKLI